MLTKSLKVGCCVFPRKTADAAARITSISPTNSRTIINRRGMYVTTSVSVACSTVFNSLVILSGSRNRNLRILRRECPDQCHLIRQRLGVFVDSDDEITVGFLPGHECPSSGQDPF